MSKSRNNNIVWHEVSVTRERREVQNGHRSAVLWFTGLSGAGKSTLAHAVEEQLHYLNCKTFVLDGDNVRHGLNSDLSFSQKDRSENIRRIGEVCRLFLEAGVITLAAFISPYRRNREQVRGIVGDDFIEIFCKCSLDTCERRDVKGMYARARRGEIAEYTGITAPYEAPLAPELVMDTEMCSSEKCVESLVAFLVERGVIPAASHNGIAEGESSRQLV